MRTREKAVDEFRKHLKEGCVYRRSEMSSWSNAVDRHLALLQEDHTLEKLSGGLYFYPKKSVFGLTRPSEEAVVITFLKDDRFLITTPNHYNALGVGTTQLYNETVVYNRKRHGLFRFGKRQYRFVRKDYFPLQLSEAFLMVDLVDNLNQLAEENKKVILERVAEKAKALNRKELLVAVKEYGGVHSKKFFGSLFSKDLKHYESPVLA
ncbi:MAG: hypothetical protein COZ46_06615 [Verrucomicrobia bacterium CG_4_10_14_3_um_filter_43_23]|nr:MAG: hypothetical protein AUJ82_05205 [Verrucomicrobia bacterium CG1_02_43_26]PIP60112.1 MAG: hypothetical protein COX01_00070 [Verrucomicrobia bacterium CG22_combo_CG10-13_8_21_14_all_43_17]PIX57907.1 MAG: hypothetical protein COZ46_06615 [Verrucomicrobia bacterium CG_4_10_14_3_um_filter_43_23]PIY61130.1 MAG: hypothetical protein COY94_06940 [Verrucomicrobia bacterium CG_4_10_14_0_8_um_filter_43_34]PJA43481.1 MAG: hypothetical protein CO175_07865 [Verrucomicrobia bacterium CG_4_9_14_3_um_fi